MATAVNTPNENHSANLSICLLMGLPGSGKSTLARKLVDYYYENKNETTPTTLAVHVPYDDYAPLSLQAKIATLSLTSAQEEEGSHESETKKLRRGFLQMVERIVRRIKHSLIESNPEETTTDFENSIHDLIFSSTPTSIILLIDDNHYYSSMRNDFYTLAKKWNLGFCTVYLQASVKTCRERNALRNESQRVPDSTIVEMSLKLEEPNSCKWHCDTYCLQIPDQEKQDQYNLPLLASVLTNSLKNPLHAHTLPDRSEEIQRERKICNENEIHQADKILRKWVSQQMVILSCSSGKSSGSDKKELSRSLNRKRVLALDMLRSGEVQITTTLDRDFEFTTEILQIVQSLKI